MRLTCLKDEWIDKNVTMGVHGIIPHRSNSRVVNTLPVKMKRIRKSGRHEEFHVNLVHNEDGTELLVLIPYDKIRITPRGNERDIEQAKFKIGNKEVGLKAIGTYADYYHVCSFEFIEESII